jgi:hypothetical protein
VKIILERSHAQILEHWKRRCGKVRTKNAGWPCTSYQGTMWVNCWKCTLHRRAQHLGEVSVS